MNTTNIAVILIIGSLILLTFVFFILLLTIEFKRKQIRNAKEKDALKHHYQREVLQTKLEVQEQTFKYVSEEIHDNIAQNLSLVKLKIFQAADKSAANGQAVNLLKTADLLGDALNDLRNLSHVLNGDFMSSLDLKECIRKEVEKFRGVEGLHLKLTITGNYHEPDAGKKILIFRVIQEAVNNAVKHGRASEINIVLDYRPGMLTVKVQDDGKGFDVKSTKAHNGMGLLNINTRAQLLGQLEISSVVGSGTCITLNIYTDDKNKTGVSR